MRNDWIFDAVQAEVAYRTEELQKAGRTARVSGRSRSWRRPWARYPEVEIPEQRAGSHDDVHPDTTRRAA